MVRTWGAACCAPTYLWQCLKLVAGAGDFGEELAEFGAIFFAGAGFDAAGDVDGVGANVEDGFGDVFGGEAAGEDDAVGFCGAAGDGPVGAVAGAAELAGFVGVEEEGVDGGLERAEGCETEALAHAHRFRDLEMIGELARYGCGFVAVELDGVEIDGAG